MDSSLWRLLQTLTACLFFSKFIKLTNTRDGWIPDRRLKEYKLYKSIIPDLRYIQCKIHFCFWRSFGQLFFFFFLLRFVFLFCNCNFINLRTSEIHLFYNLQLFYWHFLEILWLFIFLVFYKI